MKAARQRADRYFKPARPLWHHAGRRRSQCQCEAQQDALLELQSLQNELGDAGRGMQLDLSLAGDMEYYNGLVFSGYVAGCPCRAERRPV